MKKLFLLGMLGTLLLTSIPSLYAQSGIGSGTAVGKTTANPTTPRCPNCGIRLYSNTRPWDHKTYCPYYVANPSAGSSGTPVIVHSGSSSPSVTEIMAGTLSSALGNALVEYLNSPSGTGAPAVSKKEMHEKDSELPYNSISDMRTLSPGYHKVNYQWDDRAVIVYKEAGKRARPIFKKWPTWKDDAYIVAPDDETRFAISVDYKTGYVHLYDCSQVPKGGYAKEISDNWAIARTSPESEGDTYIVIGKYKKGVKPLKGKDYDRKAFYKSISWGLADMTGKEVLQCQYDSVHITGVIGNCAMICKDGKWGKIDGQLKTVIPIGYEWLGGGYYDVDSSILTHFVPPDGRHKVGLMADGSCKILIPADYDRIMPVGGTGNVVIDKDGNKSRVWIVKKDDKYGLLTTNNSVKILPVCDSLRVPSFSKERWNLISKITDKPWALLLVKVGGKWGLANYDGAAILPIIYDNLPSLAKAIDDLPKNSFRYYYAVKYLPEAKSKWETKGEYESTSEFQSRIQDKEKQLAFFSNGVEKAQTAFLLDKMMGTKDEPYDFVLSRYDADTQCFTIIDKACALSEFQLYVPRDEAISFKNNFTAMKDAALSSAKPFIYLDTFSLAEFTFNSPDGKSYHFAHPGYQPEE